MKVVLAPDGFGGTLSAREAATAIAAGWRQERPDDEVVEVPMSDGGEGLLDVVADAGAQRHRAEVAGPLGHPLDVEWARWEDGTAVIESALACGLALVPEERRDPMRATTYGVGQLIELARRAGSRRIVVGLGGSATVDGGAGALLGLGWRLLTSDGSGLKIGAEDLHRVGSVEPGWSATFDDVEVELLSDVSTVLADAARVFGPQKGASPEQVAQLTSGLEVWAEVATRDLAAGTRLDTSSGAGAAGGLGFALACAIGARLTPGARAVADLVGLPDALKGADLVITGEGKLDATSAAGKVVGEIAGLGEHYAVAVAAVVGQEGGGGPELAAVVAASPDGPGADPAADVQNAAAALARDVDRFVH